MKNYVLPMISLLSFLTISQLSQAQTAFHKNSLSVSLTGGSTRAIYTTKARGTSDGGPRSHSEHVSGLVDPLILEFGLTDKIGVGFTAGGDYYNVDATKFYNYTPVNGSGKLTSSVKYFTFDFNYHPLVTQRIDFSFYAGIGTLKVNVYDCPDQGPFQQTDQEEQNTQTTETKNPDGSTSQTTQITQQPISSYIARGNTVRTGAKLRYYCWKRVGFMAMVTGFSGYALPKYSGADSFGMGHATLVTGIATEFGICVRFF